MREAPKFGEIIAENIPFDVFVEHYIGKHNFVWENGCVIQKFRDDTQQRDAQVFLFELVRYILSAYDAGTVVFGGIPIYIKEKQALRRPDLAVFLGKKIDDIRGVYVESGIDIAIEISSRETTALDRGYKFNEYESAGIQEYWMIDPVRKDSMIYSLDDNGLYEYISGGNLLKSHLLPDIELDLNILWQDELPVGHAVNQIANNMLPDELRDKVKLIFYEGRDLYIKIDSNSLKYADLSGYDLHRAIFIEEDLSYTILKDADVRNATFENANLCGADMRCKNLGKALFTDAIYDSKTLWSYGFDSQEHGASLKT